jgi:hypothetical protein
VEAPWNSYKGVPKLWEGAVNKPVWAAFALTIALLCNTAAAQTAPNPVIENFRAYRAAIARNDLAAADTAAAAALAASEAQDGDGGRTGVLALNLALLRLDRGDAAGALPPAQRAYTLAQAGAPGVDIHLARLTAARAQLAGEDSRSAQTEMTAALDAAIAAGAPGETVQPAAIDLAMWTFAHERYEQSQAAWAIVGASVAGDSDGANYVRGRAKIGEGASLFMQSIASRRGGREDLAEGHNALNEALAVLRPLAEIETAPNQMSLAQLAYAEAVAWDGATHAVFRTRDWDIPESPEAEGDADGFIELQSGGGAAPRCMLAFDSERISSNLFPQRELMSNQVGAVVVRFVVDEAGVVQSSDVVSRVGSPGFVRAVNRLNDTWEVTRHESSEPGCRMNMTVFRSVTFIIG